MTSHLFRILKTILSCLQHNLKKAKLLLLLFFANSMSCDKYGNVRWLHFTSVSYPENSIIMFTLPRSVLWQPSKVGIYSHQYIAINSIYYCSYMDQNSLKIEMRNKQTMIGLIRRGRLVYVWTYYISCSCILSGILCNEEQKKKDLNNSKVNSQMP